jgi:GcrA cell cycle regulator
MSYGHAAARSCTCFWTDARVELLKKLWAEPGLSCRLIANELGTTRNAIIGKGGRLRLPMRPQAPRTPQAATHSPGSRPEPAQSMPVPLPVPELGDRDIPLEQRRSLLELTTATCRWPIGDPRTEAFFYCGAPTARIGQSYCPSHYARAYIVRSAA